MRAEGEGRFPAGEVGARFNMIEPREGDFVHVRFEIRRTQPSELDSFLARMQMCSDAGQFAYHYLWVPRARIVCIEPKIMEADGGIVRGIDL